MSKGGKKYIVVGIDEAGRGPLAGPLAVGAVATKISLNASKIKFWKFLIPKISASRKFCAPTPRISKIYFLRNIKDSKKLSAKKREEWREILRKNFDCQSVLIGPKIIDKIGISKAAKMAVAKILRKFNLPVGGPDLVLLDGSLFAPKHYNQKTIIKGDEKVPLIAAASIIAKTTRDAKMLRLHKKFPQYCFDRHKGYGTKLHYKMLKKYGFCPFHRYSFCK
ncbi:MAG: ribonuclease HII [Candidatus Tagabacteria bacterium]